MPESANRRQFLILTICCLSLVLVGIDNTGVNVALPAIQRGLGASVSGLQWTIDAYLLTLASGLILAGSLGDRFGRRRVFLTGLTIFTAGSTLCALAPSLGALIGARAAQGVGGAMMNPVAMAIITNVFTGSKDRPRAIGVWAAAGGISMALGPVVGGLLLGVTSWRAIFWINVPLGLAAIALTLIFVPESKAPTARRFDPIGQALGIVFLVGVTYAIIEAPHAGWLSGRTLGVFAVALAAVVGFVRYELRRAQPLIDPRLFGSLPFTGATLMAIAGFMAVSGFLFMNTLYLQDALGYSALKAGLLTLPIAVASTLVGPPSGRYVGQHGPRRPLMLAGTLFMISALLLVGLSTTTPVALLLASYAILGAAFGAVNPPVTNTAVSGMPRAQAGVAAAVATTSRQIGQTLGVAVLGSVVVARVTGPARTGLPAASHAGWWILVGCGLVVFVLGVLTTGKWAAHTAARTAARLAEPTTETEITAPRTAPPPPVPPRGEPQPEPHGARMT